MDDMSTMTSENIPQWDEADRLGKALKHRGIKVGEMADYLGVSRNTVGTRLLRSGANIRVVQTLMRHSNLATTAKYTAVDEAEQIEAIRRLAA